MRALCLPVRVVSVPLLWTGVPTSGRQERLPIFRCPGLGRFFPDHLITDHLPGCPRLPSVSVLPRSVLAAIIQPIAAKHAKCGRPRSLADADASRRRHRFSDVQRRSDLPIEWVWQYADAEQQALRHGWQGVRA